MGTASFGLVVLKCIMSTDIHGHAVDEMEDFLPYHKTDYRPPGESLQRLDFLSLSSEKHWRSSRI